MSARRVPPPPPGPPPTSARRRSSNNNSNTGFNSSNQSIDTMTSVLSVPSVPSIISSGSISNVQSGNHIRPRRGAGSASEQQQQQQQQQPSEKFSVPAGTPFDESFTEISRQKSNENLMAALEDEMDKRSRSGLGPAHPATRHSIPSAVRSSPPKATPTPTAAPPASASQRPLARRNSRDEIIMLSRHNSRDEIMLPEYDDEIANDNDTNAGLSLEDHVKMLQQELDAATAESGEMYDYRRRREDKLASSTGNGGIGGGGRCQDTTVSALSIGDPVDSFDMERESRQQQRASSKRHQQQQNRTSSGRKGGSGNNNGGTFSSKLQTNMALSFHEVLIALVVVAALSFASGHLFSSWLNPSPNAVDDGDSCIPSAERIQESPTYQHLLTKYESARKEISTLRMNALDAKENHFMETTIKASELMKKAEDHTKIAERHVENMKTTMELQKRLTDVEEMYTTKILDLEKQVKQREREAVAAASRASASGGSGGGGDGGMEQLNPMADSVRARDAQWKKHDLAMMSKIARSSHRAVLQKYGGGGPFRVEFVLKFPGEQAHAVGNRIIIETAPIGMMPHAVHIFLEMASEGMYTGTRFNFAGPEMATVNIEQDDQAKELKTKFADYSPALSFPEYNDHFTHKEYTLGFLGRDPHELPGPSFFVNLKDNTEKHGPQPGQFDEHGFEIGAYTCFGKVVSGKHVVDRIAKRARYGHGSQGKLLKPVEIINTFVHMM